MNEKLTTYLRHAITALPAVFAGFAANGFLTAEEAAKLDGDLKVFLVAISATLAGAIARWVMLVIAKHAPHLSNLFGGGSGASLPLWAMGMTTAAWGALSMAGALSMSSCSVGIDSAGGWSIRPDPLTIDAGLKYLIRHEGDAKSGMSQWVYYDPETGKEIPEEDYDAWGIKP